LFHGNETSETSNKILHELENLFHGNETSETSNKILHELENLFHGNETSFDFKLFQTVLIRSKYGSKRKSQGSKAVLYEP
jgi:replication initiation and membrane attachment protein DnaB